MSRSTALLSSRDSKQRGRAARELETSVLPRRGGALAKACRYRMCQASSERRRRSSNWIRGWPSDRGGVRGPGSGPWRRRRSPSSSAPGPEGTRRAGPSGRASHWRSAPRRHGAAASAIRSAGRAGRPRQLAKQAAGCPRHWPRRGRRKRAADFVGDRPSSSGSMAVISARSCSVRRSRDRGRNPGGRWASAGGPRVRAG